MSRKLKKKLINKKVVIKGMENLDEMPKAKSRKLYFGKDEHDAIVRYQSAEDKSIKNKIYEEEIKNAFGKLAENLIFIHGFAKDPAYYHILKNDCVAFLYETLEKFDPSRNSKAFSYFNVCAKHYLIIQTNKRNKRVNRSVRLDNFNELSARDKSAIENYETLPSPEKLMLIEEDKIRLFEVFSIIEKRIKNENEKLCISAVITLFKRIDDLEFLNKRAIFVYLREISGLNPKQLSVAMSGIRKQFRDIIKNNEEYKGMFKLSF